MHPGGNTDLAPGHNDAQPGTHCAVYQARLCRHGDQRLYTAYERLVLSGLGKWAEAGADSHARSREYVGTE